LERRLIRFHDLSREYAVEVLSVEPSGPAEQDRIAALNVEAFRRLGDLAGEKELRIGLDNLMRRGASMPYELLDLLAAIDHPVIGITLDTSRANVVGLDPATIHEFGLHLLATHISDNDGSGDHHRTPGNGSIDQLEVMKALREVGYDGLFNLEIPGERHAVLPLRALKSHFACRVAEWLLSSSDNDLSQYRRKGESVHV